MQDVYIIDGCRTPWIKFIGKPNQLSASDLAVACIKQLLQQIATIQATDLEEVVVGCVSSNTEVNIARIIALRAGCGDLVPAWTVQRNCASGLQAIDSAVKDIAIGRHDLVLAGGTEAMSKAPLFFNEQMATWLASLSSAKTIKQKLQNIIKFRPKFLRPIISLLESLCDPVINMSMGQTAEKLAFQFGISRQQMDEFAVQSHLLAAEAIANGRLQDEIVPVYDFKGSYIAMDNGVRADSNVEKLAKLRPVFDRPFGSVTAGNSSQITDGAAFLVLASKQAVDNYGLQPMAVIKDVVWSALDPSIMGLGPAHAIAELLTNNKLKMNDIDCWEINEAFAAQVLACKQAMNDDSYCKQHLGLKKALGDLDLSKVNIDGGAIALGHPVGASGARIVLHLAHCLQRLHGKQGVASLCIGGGQGGALLLESCTDNKGQKRSKSKVK